MEFKEYFISDKEGKSNCIIRTFCKLFNRKYDNVKKELLDIARQLNYDNYTEIEVFESYLNSNGYFNFDTDTEIRIKDLNLPMGKYVIFCYDKKDYYHMLSIINNVVYDKDDRSLELYVINIYKENDIINKGIVII